MAEQTKVSADIVALTADVVAAYLRNNPLPPVELPALIRSVYDSLASFTVPAKPGSERPVPAVDPKASVFPDYIISLEDGRKFKYIKRHLRLLGMSPDQYRMKWDLPSKYPMVAPNYSDFRSAKSRSLGLGRKAAVQAAQKPKG